MCFWKEPLISSLEHSRPKCLLTRGASLETQKKEVVYLVHPESRYSNGLNLQNTMNLGEAFSVVFVVTCFLLSLLLTLVFKDFLSSIPFNKRNIFTYLDNYFLNCAILRIASVSSSLQGTEEGVNMENQRKSLFIRLSKTPKTNLQTNICLSLSLFSPVHNLMWLSKTFVQLKKKKTI